MVVNIGRCFHEEAKENKGDEEAMTCATSLEEDAACREVDVEADDSESVETERFIMGAGSCEEELVG